jgi:hypothetical protein
MDLTKYQTGQEAVFQYENYATTIHSEPNVITNPDSGTL